MRNCVHMIFNKFCINDPLTQILLFIYYAVVMHIRKSLNAACVSTIRKYSCSSFSWNKQVFIV